VTGTSDPLAAQCSIDADGEQDWFSFTASSAMPVTIVVTPVGSTYDNNEQAQNGSCPTGSSINAKAVADLVLTLYGTNGTTVLAASNSTAAGFGESITSFALPAAGTYFARISENNIPASSQLYTLSVSTDCVVFPAITLHPSPQSVYNGTTVQFMGSATNTTGLRWRKDGVDLVNGGRIAGATTGTLTITAARSTDEGVYTLRASGVCASATSLGALLSVVCYPNCDGSTSAPALNVADFTCFYSSFINGNGYANCDGSTTTPALDIRDFICFQSRFIAGCP
jgi:hypothetical protein